MTKILITGAAGFLGYHLAHLLSGRSDVSVTCVDNFSRGENDRLYLELATRANVNALNVDLCREDEVARLPDHFDYIYHLAALNGTQNFYEHPVDVIRSGTLPTINLVAKYGPLGGLRRFVYAGTSESYASTVTRFGWPVPTGEDVPLGIDDIFNPRWSYAASKMHGEVVTAQAGREFDMPFSIVRYHNAYGPRMGDKHVVPDFLIRARDGRYELFGHEDTRSFMFVSDSVSATVLVAESDDCIGHVVNVGSETEVRILDLGRMMMDVIGADGEITLHESPQGSVKRRAPDTSKLRRLTGFKEKVSLLDGLRQTADFYLGERPSEK